MNTRRSCFRYLAITFIGLIANSTALGWSDQHTPYEDKLMVASYVTDVRQVILDGASRRKWRVLEEKPGQITMEVRQEHDHAVLVANALYGADFIRLQLVSATSTNCSKKSSCKLDPVPVQRWMIGLRREYGLILLDAAIVDAGGTVITDEFKKARFRSPEQSLVSPSGTEIARIAEDLISEKVTGQRYLDLAAERLVALVETNSTEERQKEYNDAIEQLGTALDKIGDGRYRDVLASVAPKMKTETLHRKYAKFLSNKSRSGTAQYRVGSTPMPTFVDNYVEGLQSRNPFFVENVAIIMREAGEKRAELFELSAKRIERDGGDSNPYAARAMANLGRFLITSNDPRYADLYSRIMRSSANRSLRRAANEGLIQLGQ